MDELLTNTVKFVEKFNDEIKADLSQKGIDNSREASNSIHIQTDESRNSVTSLGIHYLHYLDQGRGPGRFPPIDKIEDWTITKPVEIDPFLVGRKIAREGTQIYKDRSKGIQLDDKRRKLLDELKKEAPKWVKQDLLIIMKRTNKRINQ